MLEAVEEKHPGFMDSISLVAGHSLGEMTSLAAIGVFPPDVAVELVYRRGLHMQSAVHLSSRQSDTSMLYAVNPTRAKLKDVLPTENSNEDDLLAYLVELVALKVRRTTSWVEIVNYNIDQDQTVVAGDGLALSILGKCLDPQLRATAIEMGSATSIKEIVAWCAQSVYDDCKKNENYGVNDEPLPDYVPGSFHRARRGDVFARKLLTMDDGLTLPLERLSRLTLEGGGQSGLKKKSWFVPLPVSIPFHSSHLRRAADSFQADCLDALPSGALLEGKLLGPRGWVTNLTGTRFTTEVTYQQELLNAIDGENIGEYRHSGQHESQSSSLARDSIQRLGADKHEGLRHVVAITCAAQIAHAVQWSDTMEVISRSCKEVIEISPTKTLCNMFKRSHDDLLLRSLPFDERLLFQ
jgi:malonyl CoA-acyl carrier protein transacylase